jgi:Transposase DDE domain
MFQILHHCVIKGTVKSYFPRTYSYSRFVNLQQRLNFPLFAFLSACRLAGTTQGNFVDATKLIVCHNKRIFDHKVFKDLAKRGKSSTGLGNPTGFLDSNSMLSSINGDN